MLRFTCIFLGVLFMTCGLLFREGKLHIYFHIWKNMPEERKNKIRVEALCANIGTMILICGMIFLLAGLSVHFQEAFFTWDMTLWLIAGGIDICYIVKSRKFIRAD